ncbi:lysine transporter LysE [Halopseudomonas oceani]|uniref:Lysine transporter LysE n=1 Tax=Halopseudomonas oceani TaxID=1708783 RepID=A0A2P4ET31_9GAMM|nr:LysE family transporter [Halopseudomonas oceani]POB02450.1 lysine transporter LysE [Halopseudomonas oceani]GGE47946.1 lysine transporter LysE [Halopseudomonas oceani]
MYLNEFLLVALVHLLAVISPGPDFAVVIRNSVSGGHRVGLYTAVGVGTGIFVHVAYSLLGIGLIVSQSVWLFNLMKLLAAAYLIYIGVRALRAQPVSADQPLTTASQLSARQAFIQGFITNGLNPKATLFFLSLFTVVISHDTPLPVQAGYGVYLAFATGAWFCLVAMLFSRDAVRRAFNRLGHWFDRLMGGVLIGLGLHLALSQWLKRG